MTDSSVEAEAESTDANGWIPIEKLEDIAWKKHEEVLLFPIAEDDCLHALVLQRMEAGDGN